MTNSLFILLHNPFFGCHATLTPKNLLLKPEQHSFPFFNPITASSCGVDYIACIRPCRGVNSTRIDSRRRVVTQFVSWFVSLFGVCGDLTADHISDCLDAIVQVPSLIWSGLSKIATLRAVPLLTHQRRKVKKDSATRVKSSRLPTKIDVG